jgi:short-subunit dehydrogenase
MKKELQGRWALVTGASSGLGVDFARELAARGANVILAARREDRLRQLGQELERGQGVAVDVVALDLSEREGPQRLFERTRAASRTVDLLVNNAGYGLHGKALEIPWEREAAMLDLDIRALVELTRLYAGEMVARGFGRILQVSSIGAFQPCPTYAAYGAAKSFVLNYAQALDFELRGTGVSCTVIAPGVTATEFMKVAGQRPTWFTRATQMTSARVAAVGVAAMLRRKRVVVPGIMNKLGAWSQRLLSLRMSTALAHATMREASSAPEPGAT